MKPHLEHPKPRGPYKYYDFIMVIFVSVLLCSNLIGPAKAATFELPFLGSIVFGAGVLFFPITYLFGDILTEVYGYARARKVIWAGFGALGFASLMAWIVVNLTPAESWPHQQAYEIVFGSTWRIVLASILAYFCGEFCNSYILAKMKVWMKGRYLWMRTIGSTLGGQGVDSLIFYPVAFWNLPGWENEQLIKVMMTNYLLKVAWEVLATPFTYKIVSFLKRKEGLDPFDHETDFNPFHIISAEKIEER